MHTLDTQGSLCTWTTILLLFVGAYSDRNSPFNPYDLKDCRNETAPPFSADGRLRVLSWHIHYTTNSSDQKRFYYEFIKEFQSLFPPKSQGNHCPFGPNFGQEVVGDKLKYNYVCSLERSYEEPWEAKLRQNFEKKYGVPKTDKYGDIPAGEKRESRRQLGNPWHGPQRAFYVPLAHMEPLWEWSQQHREYVDVLLHPNTGCMHDDHTAVALGGRGQWVIGKRSTADPAISVKEFPCNMPATGCNDLNWRGPPSCGCSTPLKSDAPSDSCKNCKAHYLPIHLDLKTRK